jgi:hypothetical protein
MLMGLKPDIWPKYLAQIEIRRDAGEGVMIATAVTSAIRAAAEYVRAHPQVVESWTVGDYRSGFNLTIRECAQLRAEIRAFDLVEDALEWFEDLIDVGEAVDWVRRHVEDGEDSDDDIRREAAKAAEDAVWQPFMDNLDFGRAGDRHRAMIDAAMARMGC